ncbi:WYL domain-containing protein [Clostridiaceae bacterium NSJ-31]|uniref:WYL domain-containing protein n=1 Tax=Ligaoa zhengdingensis TaxID=2763658 RepID=A0A926DUS5_9FIRM|nr:WYL domain-containing protein [Ligaoa zhengdingensis]
MSEFSELIKNFDKIREYMRDFYVYGFKTRGDYTAKSARTYDNERRRIESWLSHSVRWENSARGKRVFLSVDSARVPQNPLYAAWKSKSFTKTDIRLHFFLLDLFADGEARTTEQAADAMSERYGAVFDAQTVRAKLREYEREGVMRGEKRGRALYYTLSARALDSMPCRRELLDAVRFFQEVAPFGFVGSTLLDTAEEENDLFYFKHHFIVHTLEDGVLGALTDAIDGRRSVTLENYSRRSGHRTFIQGIPLRILVSVQSGRRYVCLYRSTVCRFVNLRLDSIAAVLPGESVPEFEALQQALDRALPSCWGVSFGGRHRKEQLFMKLRIDAEQESYLLDRVRREGRGGELLQIDGNTFLYSIETYDANEMMSWIKTFTGRILSLECTDSTLVRKFCSDMRRMYDIYCGEGKR